MSTLAVWYPQLKLLHVALALISVGFFTVRATAFLAGRAWPRERAARSASVAIDTALFSAGVALWAFLQLNPARDGWLAWKLGLIVAYILLGALALGRTRRPSARRLALAGAWLCAIAIVVLALQRPLLPALLS